MLHSKKIVSLLFFLLIAYCSAFSKSDRLANMQGLSLNGDMIFELEGYTITIVNEKGELNEKTIKKLKKKYNLSQLKKEYKDSSIDWDHLIIEDTTHIKGLPKDIWGYDKCFLFPQSDNRFLMVLFQSSNKRDLSIENAFMNAFFDRKIASYASKDWTAHKINFAGREIDLGNICSWVSPQNVHCASFGQMSWAVFATMQEALTNTLIMEASNINTGKYEVEKDESIDILFEGIPTTAKRVTYRIKGSKILLGGRNMIAVYYITQRVRNNYVSCMLTNYIEEKGNYKLPILLQEVIVLQ